MTARERATQNAALLGAVDPGEGLSVEKELFENGVGHLRGRVGSL